MRNALNFDNITCTANKQYRSPTEKFFEKLSKEKQDVEQEVVKKQHELSENGWKPLTTATLGNKKACSNHLCICFSIRIYLFKNRDK